MPAHLSDEAKSAVDGLLKAYPGGSHPGTVVGLVNKQGEIIYLNGFGPKTANEPEPLSTSAVFASFSCTKVITGLALLHLVENGGLDLDRPVEDIVPELKDKQLIEDSTESTVKLGKAKTKITTRHLLTHTAGFGYSWYNAHLKHWFEQNGQPSDYKDIPLVNEPGEQWEYGLNLDWAGIVLERVTGKKLGKYCDEHLFKPLGLKNITFDITSRPDLQARLTTLHQWDAATNTFTPRAYPTEVSEVPLEGGGAGVFSTAEDFLQLLVVLLNGGKGANGTAILNSETYQAMFTNQVNEILDLPTTDKSLAWKPLEALPEKKKGWGLTFLLNLEDIPNGRKAGSAEWGGIANLFWLADPTSEIGVIIFNNVLPYGIPAFFDLIDRLQETIYAPGALVTA